MAPNELRLGNWVYSSVYGKAIQIVYGAQIENGRDYDGIVITEEWLLKLGWQKFVGKHPHLDKTRYFIRHKKTFVSTFKDKIEQYIEYHFDLGPQGCMGIYFEYLRGPSADEADDLNQSPPKMPDAMLQNFAWGIKEVHRLQNLWQDITDEEVMVGHPTTDKKTTKEWLDFLPEEWEMKIVESVPDGFYSNEQITLEEFLDKLTLVAHTYNPIAFGKSIDEFGKRFGSTKPEETPPGNN